MQIDTPRPARIHLTHLLIILFIVLIGSAYLTPPTVSQAANRDEPTPTPVAISPHSEDIVGGNLADAGEYPWQVALVYASKPNPYEGQFCGGTLIARQWVLTAGHCVADDYGDVVSANTIDVVLGINVLSQGRTYGNSGQRIGVAQIYLYPGFNYGSQDELNQDAALLKLGSVAVLNPLVSTIALASPSDTSQVAAGVTATTTGWGATSASGSSYPDALREVQVPIVSYDTCSAGYGGLFNLNNAYHLCAGLSSGGKDSCYGDSGGPLIVRDGTRWLQVGIVSFGESCAQPNYYGIYARVSYFKSWIDSIVFPTPVELENPIYLPLYSISCTPDAPGDSDNIADALTICNGNTISGTTRHSDDMDDVYAIFVKSGKTLTITMTGSGGDSDLYLFPPGTEDVTQDDWYIRSTNDKNTENISTEVGRSGYWYVDIYSRLSSTTTTNYQIKVTVSDS